MFTLPADPGSVQFIVGGSALDVSQLCAIEAYTIKKFQTEVGSATIYLNRTYKPRESSVGAFNPTKGMQVEIFSGWGKKLFGGHIYKVDWQSLTNSSLDLPARRYVLECTDFTRVLDERLFYAVYDNVAAGEIIRDIIYNQEYRPGSGFKLNDNEGIQIKDVTDVVDGPLISIIANGDSAARFFDRIVELCNTDLFQFGWWVGVDREVYFKPLDIILAKPAGFQLSASDAMTWESLRVEETDEKYANQVQVQVSIDSITPVDDTFVGNGTDVTFDLALPPDKVTRITVNDVDQTFIEGNEIDNPSYDWYWTRGSVTITQNTAGVVLTGAETLIVSSISLFSNIAEAVDETEQGLRATVEGGSGRHQLLVAKPDITSLAAGQALADALLSRYKRAGIRLSFSTFKPNESYYYNLEPGQLLQGTPNDLLVIPNPPFMVDSLTIQMTSGGRGRSQAVRYDVTAFGGSLLGNYIDFFRALAKGATGSGGGSVGSYDEGFWHIAGTLRLGRNGTVHHQFSRNCSPVYAFASLLSGVVASSNVVIDLKYKPSGSSIFGANKITILTGQADSVEPVAFSMSNFLSRDKVELNVLSTGGARDCVVYLFSV
jgi:hypothetical protein